ncbi:Hpt domain-containing protein [Tateyamaria armeniaca]|uniref:Hpt domain-containing protein n=1 Tax=Tateyamaria armeniaca TaxID=2518930 RepID=A0ABW8UQG4_9RHOB
MIDWQRVINLREEIGEEDFDEVVPLFIEEVTEITDRLSTAVDLNTLEEDLHCLKGSALNLGFSLFADLCGAGESLAARGEAASVDVPAILNSFETSKRAFLAGLQDGIAA